MHENCKYSSIPESNYEFWKNKLEGNVERDKKNYAQLESMGIKVIVVWGCEIKKMMKDKELVQKRLDNLVYEIIRIVEKEWNVKTVEHNIDII